MSTTKEERDELALKCMRSLRLTQDEADLVLRLLDEREEDVVELQEMEIERTDELRSACSDLEKAEAEVARLKAELGDARDYAAEIALGTAHSTICEVGLLCMRCQRDDFALEVARLKAEVVRLQSVASTEQVRQALSAAKAREEKLRDALEDAETSVVAVAMHCMQLPMAQDARELMTRIRAALAPPKPEEGMRRNLLPSEMDAEEEAEAKRWREGGAE